MLSDDVRSIHLKVEEEVTQWNVPNSFDLELFSPPDYWTTVSKRWLGQGPKGKEIIRFYIKPK